MRTRKWGVETAMPVVPYSWAVEQQAWGLSYPTTGPELDRNAWSSPGSHVSTSSDSALSSLFVKCLCCGVEQGEDFYLFIFLNSPWVLILFDYCLGLGQLFIFRFRKVVQEKLFNEREKCVLSKEVQSPGETRLLHAQPSFSTSQVAWSNLKQSSNRAVQRASFLGWCRLHRRISPSTMGPACHRLWEPERARFWGSIFPEFNQSRYFLSYTCTLTSHLIALHPYTFCWIWL